MASISVAARRRITDAAIAVNPSEIVITRTSKARAGSGFADTTTTLTAFTGRVFLGNTGANRRTSGTPGARQEGEQCYLLAPWHADVQASSTVTDVFECDGVRYRVEAVLPVRLSGAVVSLQCPLVALS